MKFTELERIYHPFTKWEDFKGGMYEKTCFMDENQMIIECEMLLKCPEWLEEAMKFVSHNWIYSAEHNLTNINRNRQAWLGQAACCFTHGAPEYITKIAWHNLTITQQESANKIADEVITDWENKYKVGYFTHGKNQTRNECIRSGSFTDITYI